MNQDHDQNKASDKESAKESAKKVDARDHSMSRGNSQPMQRNQSQGAHGDQNKPPSDRAVRGFDAPDHQVKEDLHKSVRKD